MAPLFIYASIRICHIIMSASLFSCAAAKHQNRAHINSKALNMLSNIFHIRKFKYFLQTPNFPHVLCVRVHAMLPAVAAPPFS